MFQLRIPDSYKLLPEISCILSHPDFISMRQVRHHGNLDCYSHSLRVAETAYLMASRLESDIVSIIRGALLHDFYLYDWHERGHSLHAYRHPYIALREAKARFELNPIEIDSISKHMFPLIPFIPLYKESWIVCIADKVSTVKDYMELIGDHSTDAEYIVANSSPFVGLRS